MKICWDNLEKLKYINGYMVDKYFGKYRFGHICDYCGDEYLESIYSRKSGFCTVKCCNDSRKVPFHIVKQDIESEGYILVSNEKDYMNSNNTSQYKMIVICDQEHKYHVTWNNWKKSKRCGYCIGNKPIEFRFIEKSFIDEGYTLYMGEGSYKNNKQMMSVKCDKGHKYRVSWNNWSKGKRCRKCYELDKWNKSVRSKSGFNLYEHHVRRLTKINYKLYKSIIDPEGLRGNKYHLDHKYSISQGFKDGILPYIMGSCINLELITQKENNSKQGGCSISKKELLDGYYKSVK